MCLFALWVLVLLSFCQLILVCALLRSVENGLYAVLFPVDGITFEVNSAICIVRR